jgi:hypothetical protein
MPNKSLSVPQIDTQPFNPEDQTSRKSHQIRIMPEISVNLFMILSKKDGPK